MVLGACGYSESKKSALNSTHDFVLIAVVWQYVEFVERPTLFQRGHLHVLPFPGLYERCMRGGYTRNANQPSSNVCGMYRNRACHDSYSARLAHLPSQVGGGT